MQSLNDYGLMSLRASVMYFTIIQGFGYLLGLEYSAFQLFVIPAAGVAFFNIWNYIGGLGACGLMDEREMELLTVSMAYGFVAAIAAISLVQSGIYDLTAQQIGGIGYGVFLALFIGRTGYHRLG